MEELPSRRARGLSHIPPEWVESSDTFFITINCKPRGRDHLIANGLPAKLFESVAFLRDRGKWFPELVLLMPDHLHALVSFSWEKDRGMNRVLADWKRYVATRHGISWQRDYFDHRIRSAQDHASTWVHIRENPVRAALVADLRAMAARLATQRRRMGHHSGPRRRVRRKGNNQHERQGRDRPKPAIIFIFITLFLDIFGIGVIIPVLPKLVEQLQGGDVQAAAHSVGWLGALYALMQFIFSPVLGSLSDRFGRRPVILASLFGSGIDYLVLAWAPTIGWLYLARVVSGITAANFSAASAYIADVTPPEKRAAGFGMIGAAFGLGFIAGPAIGGLLGTHGLRTPFLVAAGITLLNWLYGAFVLPESLAPENRRPFQWSSAHPVKAITALGRWPVVLGLAGSHFLAMISSNIYPCLWVLYTGTRYGWNSKQVGISLALVGIMAAIVQAGLAGRILKIIGERRGVYAGLFIMAVAMTCYGAAPEGWMLYGIILVGSLAGVGQPATQSIISQAVPADEQGAVQGALNSITSVAGIIAPLLWTSLFSWAISAERTVHLPGLPFYGAGALALAAAFLAWRAFQKQAA